MIQSVLMLSPEPPYPLHGGGAFRIASLIHYFARFAQVDLVLFSESGKPAVLPPGVRPDLLRSQTVIRLPFHSRLAAARYLRNARRAVQGVPPLIDRLAGHAAELTRVLSENSARPSRGQEPGDVAGFSDAAGAAARALSGNSARPGCGQEPGAVAEFPDAAGAAARALSGKHYDLGIVEHFWCAPYLEQVSAVCHSTMLDLHNIESVLHARCAQTSRGLVAAGQRRFTRCSEELEKILLPRFSVVLAASHADATTVRIVAPAAQVAVCPNTIPLTPAPQVAEEPIVVFSGNFEYHPNIDAVRYLVSSIWPLVRESCPDLRLRLVGRGDKFIRHLLPSGLGIQVTGAVDDALAEIAAARIVVAPLRSGSGTRVKILEAWAAARPVVATSLAAEGLEYGKDRDLLIANDVPSIAGAIAGLNADPERRARLAASGRRLFEERYTWQVAWRALDSVTAWLPGGTGTSHRYTEDSDANRR